MLPLLLEHAAPLARAQACTALGRSYLNAAANGNTARDKSAAPASAAGATDPLPVEAIKLPNAQLT